VTSAHRMQVLPSGGDAVSPVLPRQTLCATLLASDSPACKGPAMSFQPPFARTSLRSIQDVALGAGAGPYLVGAICYRQRTISREEVNKWLTRRRLERRQLARWQGPSEPEVNEAREIGGGQRLGSDQRQEALKGGADASVRPPRVASGFHCQSGITSRIAGFAGHVVERRRTRSRARPRDGDVRHLGALAGVTPFGACR
jgi:hypothetical protein